MAKGDFETKAAEWSRKAAEWAQGRNGADNLSNACANVAILIVVIDLFARTWWLSLLALILLGYSWFRISSKNIAARRKENAAFTKQCAPAVPWLVNPIAAAKEGKDYKHLSCPSCGQRVRIPRGKGKVRVTCPKCHEKFDGRA